jgi:DNA-binding LacI/PurR family transcriptional regulator
MQAAVELTHQALPVIRELGLTAVMYQSTPGAFAACQVFHEAGIQVGKDISVMGSGDYEFVQYASPALTVLASDYVQMAKDAVDLLVDKPAGTPSLLKYPPKLIERNSVCRID